jgi:hypothetical protein
MTAAVTSPASAPVTRTRLRPVPTGWVDYVLAAVLSFFAAAWVLELWKSPGLSVPWWEEHDAISSAAHFHTTLMTGWYESQPLLGFPYGQHYHDFPFSDDLQLVMVRIFGVFSSNWPVVFNLYFLAGFPLAAIGAVWFLRRCHLARPFAVVLAVLYAITPYHWYRNETHFFLAEYWMVPFALGLVLAVVRGESIWGVRRFTATSWWTWPAGVLTGRGAATVAIVALTTWSGNYYGVYTAVLLVGAAVLAFLRSRDWRKLAGAAVATVVLAVSFVLVTIPDKLYAAQYGTDPGALKRFPYESEMYALKFLAMMLPAPGHPWTKLADLRAKYDSEFPFPAEEPALGTIGAIGFLVLLVVLAFALVGRWTKAADKAADKAGDKAGDTAVQRRGRTLLEVAMIAILAFLAAMPGGVGSILALFVTDAIRDWNRMSIFIVLLALAGAGLALQGGLARLTRRRQAVRSVTTPVLYGSAVLVLVFGVWDSSLTIGVPDYAGTTATWNSEQQFVDGLEARLPSGAALYEMPYRPWPESDPVNRTEQNDQLRLFLHSSTLRWSGGGFMGRPQTDWPATLEEQPAGDIAKDLAIVGFSGIVLDTYATQDNGAALEARFAPYTGAPQLTSADGRWVFLSLDAQLEQVRLTMSEQQRADQAAVITNGATRG